MGDKFTNPPNSTLDEVERDTDFKTPLIFILSPGADPLLGLMVRLLIKGLRQGEGDFAG